MRLRNGLLVVFGLLFLLSGISLLLLIIDDKKDLSSRASFTPSVPRQVELPADLPSAGAYDPNWHQIEEDFFINQLSGDTVRVLPKDTNEASISSILGTNFSNGKKIETISFGGITTTKFTYKLFGEEKRVNLWSKGNDKLLEVGSLKNDNNLSIEVVNQLLQTVQSQNVLGASTPDAWAQVATLTRPSVVSLLNHYCAELKFFSLPDFSLSDKVYPFCLTSMGTGFFVSQDGLLATNGHIVRNLPKSSIYYALASGKLDNLLIDFMTVYLTQTTGKPVSPDEVKNLIIESKKNKDSLYQLGGTIVDLNQKNILKFQNEKNHYYIQLNTTPAEITESGVKETESVIKASLVATDYEEVKEGEGFVSSDVAILKADAGSFPALPLGELDDAVVGSELQVVGFPQAASSGTLALLDSSLAEPTFTKGLVSAVKLAKGNQKKLIQTDAVINHGNSGGPGILASGSVVGIATYGVSVEGGSGSYNFLRDIKDLKDLIEKNNLKLAESKIYSDWQDGLKNYYLGYFRYASAKFDAVKTSYPQHPTVEKYLQDSNKKIGTVEDLTPFLTVSQRQTLIILSSVFMLISFIGFCFVYFFKKNGQVVDNQPSQMPLS